MPTKKEQDISSYYLGIYYVVDTHMVNQAPFLSAAARTRWPTQQQNWVDEIFLGQLKITWQFLTSKPYMRICGKQIHLPSLMVKVYKNGWGSVKSRVW